LPLSAVDTIPIAFRHAVEQTFKPFRFGQWNRLAFVGLLAGELGSGGCHVSNNFNVPSSGGGEVGQIPHLSMPTLSQLGIDPAALAAVIAVLVVSALVLGFVFMYISSVMRFILFDSVLTRECRIGAGWSRRQGEGFRYFLFKIAYFILTVGGLAVLLGIPAALALAAGWFRDPKQHIAPLVLVGVLAFAALGIFLLLMAVGFVLTKDFVVPQMALEGIGVVESWRRLWGMIGTDKGSYAFYIILKIVLAMGAALAVGIATVVLGFVIAVPAIAMSLIAIITGQSAGLTWNVYTITLAVVVGSILLAVFLYLVSLISVPVIVFFPAYSIHFFAARYPRLEAALHPTVVTAPAQDLPPAPPLPPNPEPI